MEFRLGSARRIFVPGADRQTVVTAKDPVADGSAELGRNLALMLDRQIGNTAPRIEPVGSRKGMGRTNVETAGAGAAMVVLGRIGRQFGIGQNGAEKQP